MTHATRPVVLFAGPGSDCYYDSWLSSSAYLAAVDDDGG